MKGKRISVKRILALIMVMFIAISSVGISPVKVEAAPAKTAKSITLNHSTYTLKKGKTVKLKATVLPKTAKNKTIVWKSSKKSVATVTSKGVVKGIKNGTATITATVKGTKIKATCKITVGTPVTKVTVPKKTISLEVGKSYTIKPTVTPKKASNKKVTYTSSKKSVATVNSKGKVTAKKVGTVKITVKATDGSNKKATVTVKVTPVMVKKVTVNATKTKLAVGESVKLTASVSPVKATNKEVSWSSSNNLIATVSADGTVIAKSAGIVTIKATAKDGSKKYGSVQITVEEVKASSVTVSVNKTKLKVGETAQATATILPSNVGNKSVKWSSSDANIATVDATKGVITAKKAGTVTITAMTQDGSKKYGSIKITVEAVKVTSVTVAVSKTTLDVGETMQATATVLPVDAENKAVKWTSSDANVATVDATKGIITAKKAGTVIITATAQDGSGKSDSVKITVKEVLVQSVSINSSVVVLKINQTEQLKAIVLPENATNKKVVWQSENVSVAIVDQTGLVTAVQNGEAIITATTEDGNKVAQCKVIVGVPITSITLSETVKTIAAGRNFQLEANILPGDATNKTVVWTSSDTTIAEVSENGLVTTKRDGVVTITAATLDNKVKATCKVTVATEPTSIYLDTTAKTININDELVLNATVVPEYAANKNIIWTSSDVTVASVENGVVKGVKAGSAIITARTEVGNLMAVCNITVGDIVSVNSYAELTSTLAGRLPAGIVLNTTESGAYEIPEGDYSGVTLIVNAPNATITNHATFQKVEIQSISADTWIEKATGNTIDIIASEAHVVVDGENVAIQVNPGVSKVEIETNGTVENITVATNAEISISGSNLTEIPVATQAEGAVIKTSVPVAIEAAQDVTLQMKPGAENSKIAVDNETVNLVVQGIGTIPITNKETGTVTDVVAENIEIEDDEEVEAITGLITGQVCDAQNEAVQGAVVYVIPYTSTFDQNDIEAAIEAAENQDRCYITDTNELGQYTVNGLAYGNYVLIVKADNLQNYFQTIILNQEVVTNETIVMVEYTDATGSVKGTLYDAFDANVVAPGIDLFLRKGANNTTDEVIAQTVTDAKGGYKFENVLPGTYTIQVVDTRADVEQHYVRMSFNVVVLAGVVVDANMTITKTVEGDQIRFVLTWGPEADAIARDLDSHLIGPSALLGGKFHVYYSDESYYADGIKYADLDVDDTTWEGPETTTIYQTVDGVYHFYIYDYSNQENSENMKLANSQAMVKVYIGDRNIATYHVPNNPGTLWDVCTYDVRTNTLTPINTVYYHPGDSRDVGIEAVDIAKNELAEVIDRYSDYDFGSALEVTIQNKIQDAYTYMETATEYEEVIAYRDSLENYFNNLIESTEIWHISMDELYNYNICRQGNWCYCGDEAVQLSGYSIIHLTTYGLPSLENLSISFNDANASYEWADSDREEFTKVLLVTNSETQVVERYYVQQQERIPAMYPSYVTEEGNYICDWWWSENATEEGFAGTIYIEGENQTLENPIFEFYDSNVRGEYTAVEGEDYAGILTSTYGDRQSVYMVSYVQRIRSIYLDEIKEEGNILWIDYWHYYYDDDENEEYKIYEVSGYRETIGDDVSFIFDDIIPDSVTCEAEAGEYWTHKLTVVYKGITTIMYLNYKQDPEINILPTGGSYIYTDTWGDSVASFWNVDLITCDGIETVRATGYPENIDLSTISFYGDSRTEYEIIVENDIYYLVISVDGAMLEKYPLIYEKEIGKMAISVTEADNCINDFEQEAYEQIYVIYGENPTLVNPVFTVDGADIVYTEITDSEDYVGKIDVSYKTQKLTYYVKYIQRIREIYLSEIEDAGNILWFSWDYDYYYDEDGHSYKVYDINGYRDTLGTDASFAFNGVTPESVTCEEEAGECWTHKLTVVYKGVPAIIYLNYQKDMEMDLVPHSGAYEYTEEWGGNDLTYFDSVLLIDEDGQQKISLIGRHNEIDWTTVVFYGMDGVTYKVINEGEEHYLSICIGDEEEEVRYLLCYECLE